MRAAFFGTPDISVPALQALHDIADVAAVICQPDKPAGRGLTLRAPAVKVRAEQLGLPVHQPTKVRTKKFARWLRELELDVALVIAYGRILPKRVLNAPRCGCMNLHASLLPHYRGAAPITWAVVNGETQSGITLMQMDEGMDTGPMLSKHVLAVGPDETAGELYQRMAALAAEVVKADLVRAVAGELQPEAQDHEAASMAPMLNKHDGAVRWAQPARKVHDHVRGMSPWPGAHGVLGGKRFKLLQTRLAGEDGSRGEPGEVIALHDDSVEVACAEGSIHLLRGQVAGKKALAAAQLIAGRTLTIGKRFEEVAPPQAT